MVIELDKEEQTILQEAIDNYLGDLLRKQYCTKEDNRKKQVLTNINNQIAKLSQQD